MGASKSGSHKTVGAGEGGEGWRWLQAQSSPHSLILSGREIQRLGDVILAASALVAGSGSVSRVGTGTGEEVAA